MKRKSTTKDSSSDAAKRPSVDEKSSTSGKARVDIFKLQVDYQAGNKAPLEALMRAWKKIKELDPSDPRSFFSLGGTHGEPFRGAGWSNNNFWGGWCNHGNVLFPTWHRIYCLKLEEALQFFEPDVTLPYWDETSEESLTNGIPAALTWETFELDGETIPNPLRSYVFSKIIVDNVSADVSGESPSYSKPKGYETVRYPYSGLVGTPKDREETKKHNAQWTYDQSVTELNKNIVGWLTDPPLVNGQPVSKVSVLDKFRICLQAPNYTLFSNTSSAQQYNSEIDDASAQVVPLESPHNDVHLAVGGFDWGNADISPIPGANGDMGENDTAGFDPIFFFHHCNIDRMFWIWQKLHGATDKLEIIKDYPGTNSVDSQGPTPGVAPNAWLDLQTPLQPFTKASGEFYTSCDAINIANLGYSYAPGSLDPAQTQPSTFMKMVEVNPDYRLLRAPPVNRGAFRGSFVILAYANVNGHKVLVGRESVLSRWSVRDCANCQLHLRVKPTFRLNLAAVVPDLGAKAAVEFRVQSHDGVHVL